MGSTPSIQASVVVVGGGYAGTIVARKLDPKLQVTLLEREDGITHRIATLRAAVVPGWERRVRMNEVNVLRRGQVRQATVVRVEPGKVVLGDGTEIPADYVVMATGGSGFLFPMGGDGLDEQTYVEMLVESQKTIKDVGSVLIVGGGAVGVEMAGEIKAAHPEKSVTLVHSGAALLDNAPVAIAGGLATSLMRQMADLGITVHLNARLEELPPSPSGPVASAIRPTPGATHRLSDGTEVAADLVYVATGWASKAMPAASMLPEGSVDDVGRIKVNASLQVEGLAGVYAVGDCTNVLESKMAYTANLQAPTVIKNILAEARGKSVHATYTPAAPGKVGILVPLGDAQGAVAFGSVVLGAWLARNLKGKDLMTSMLISGERGIDVPPKP